MRPRGSDGKFLPKNPLPTPTSGKALIEHAGHRAVGLFAGIDPQVLADLIQASHGSVGRIVKRGGTVQVWMQSPETGVGERLAEALRRAGVDVELKASP